MSDRTPSWKDRLHRSPKGSFVGRTVQLQAFRSTLATPLEQRETLRIGVDIGIVCLNIMNDRRFSSND